MKLGYKLKKKKQKHPNVGVDDCQHTARGIEIGHGVGSYDCVQESVHVPVVFHVLGVPDQGKTVALVR